MKHQITSKKALQHPKGIVSLAIVLGIFFLQSCSTPQQPEFKYVENVKLVSSSTTEMLIEANAVFFNPNNMGILLQEVNVDLTVDDKKVGNVLQTNEIKIEKQTDFTVPLRVSVAPEQIFGNLLSTLLNAVASKKAEIKYVGFVRVKAGGISFKVPVNYTEKIKLN